MVDKRIQGHAIQIKETSSFCVENEKKFRYSKSSRIRIFFYLNTTELGHRLNNNNNNDCRHCHSLLVYNNISLFLSYAGSLTNSAVDGTCICNVNWKSSKGLSALIFVKVGVVFFRFCPDAVFRVYDYLFTRKTR